MKDLISLEMITPIGNVYEGSVKLVVLPGSEGEFGVLKGHCSVITSLNSGIVDIEKEDGFHELVAIDGGHCKVDENKITVLAKDAIYISGDDAQIEQNIQKAKDLLKSISSDSTALASTFSKIDNARFKK